ncbi:ABC transporter substrate-binding protein [Candidatus Peribacteria bacterium]|nr:ABC transporter substrate-binding protein [Candidatus Peribacteria bacterium]
MKYTAFSAFAVLLLAGCGSQVTAPTGTSTTASTTPTAEAPAPTVEPFVIGGVLPLTGDGAIYGTAVQQAAMLAVEDINAAGGIHDRPLEVRWEDGKCNPKDASAAAQKLVNIDKVPVIFGGGCSGETLAAAPITEKAQVILFSPMSSSPDVTEAGDFVFRNFPSDSIQGKIMAEYANEKGYQKVAMLTEQTDYAVAVARVFQEYFAGEVMEETFLSTESDFKTRITKIKNADADALFLNPQTPAKMELLMKQLQEQQVMLPILGNEFIATDNGKYVLAFRDFLGDRDVAGAAFLGVDTPAFQDFVTRYEAQYGPIEIANYAGVAYDGMHILGNILNHIPNPSDTAAIRDSLYAMPVYAGISGDMAFDENGDVTNLAHTLLVFNGTDFVPAE